MNYNIEKQREWVSEWERAWSTLRFEPYSKNNNSCHTINTIHKMFRRITMSIDLCTFCKSMYLSVGGMVEYMRPKWTWVGIHGVQTDTNLISTFQSYECFSFSLSFYVYLIFHTLPTLDTNTMFWCAYFCLFSLCSKLFHCLSSFKAWENMVCMFVTI